MNKINPYISVRSILQPSPAPKKAIVLFSALAVIGAVGAVICYYKGLGTLPIILSASGSGGMALAALAIYGTDRIRIGLMLRNLLKEKTKYESIFDAACTLGDQAAIKWLVEHGANPNLNVAPEHNWFTPLVLVAQKRSLPAVRCLIENGAKVNEQSPMQKRTALHEAAKNNDLKMVEYLLANKADPNLQDNLRRTPLHHAAENNNLNMAKLLLKYGANHTLRSERGTPYDIAPEGSRVKTAVAITESPTGASHS